MKTKLIIIPILFVFLFFCKEKGIKNDKKKLFEQDISDYSLKGKTVYNGNFYIVTQIRINQGKIEEATEKYGSKEWASLPPGRYGQPNKTMKEALALYEKYFKEELEGKSDLYIKKGFLKEFSHICNCQGDSVKQVKCTKCNENHVDLADENNSKWQTPI